MPRGDKSKYSDKQVRQAEHIEAGYEARGVPKAEAERRAWATENKVSGGGRKPGGSGRATATTPAPRAAAGKKAATRRPRTSAKA